MHFKILKSLLIIFILIILALVAVSLLIRTGAVQQRLVGFVEDSVSKNLRQEFSMGRVDFDVIRGVIIHNIQLDIDGNDFIKVETLEIGYPFDLSIIVKQLAQRQITVDNIKIDKLYLNISKRNDGNWNYSALQKHKDEKVKSTEEKSSNSSWRLKILSAVIYESEIVLKTDNQNSAKTINISEFKTSLDLNTSGNSEVRIENGYISIQPNDLIFTDLMAHMKFNREEVDIKQVRFDLNGSPVTFSAGLGKKGKKIFDVKTEIRDFKFKEGLINFALSGSGELDNINNINGDFKVKIENSEYLGNKFSFNSNDTKIQNSKLIIHNASLDGDFGKARLDLSADIRELTDKNSNNHFKIKLLAEDIKYSNLIDIKKFIDPGKKIENEIIVNVEFNAEGYFNDEKDFNIDTDLTKLSVSGAAGRARLSGQAKIRDKLIKLKLKGSLEEFDMQYFTSNINFRSSLNTKINIDTELPLDIDIKKTKGNINIDILRSSFSGKEIKGGVIYSEFQNENIKNARLNLISDFLTIELSGNTTNNQLNFNYYLESNDLQFISDLKPDLNLSGSLKADGTIKGDISSPVINYSVNTSQNKFNSIGVVEINSNGTIKFKDDFIVIDSDGEILDLDISGNKFSKIEYKIKSQAKDLICSVNAIKNENNTIEAEFRLPDIRKNKQIEFNKLLLSFNGLIYENDSPFYVYFSDGLKVDGFNLNDGNSSVNVNLSKKSKEIDSEITIQRFNIENIFNLVGSEESPIGILSGTINTSGSPQNIKYQTNLEIENFKYREFESDTILINSYYKRPGLSLDINSSQGGQYTLNLSGNIQTDLDLEDLGNSIKDSQMNLLLKSNHLDLSPVSKFVGSINEIHGYLGSSLEIQGKINSPLLYGDISLNNIELKLKSLNNKLTLQDGNIVFEGSNARLNDIVVSSGDGKGVINGNFDIRNLNYDLKANLDQLTMKPKTVKINVSGELSLTGKEKRVNIAGKIKLNKTRISLKDSKSKQASDIKFVDDDQENSDEIIIKDKKESNYFMDNVSMDLGVKIPKNSWVRGKGANVEIKGNIEIDKEYEDQMVLTGNISTVRGTYKIFGKLFKIQEGNVNFPGIKQINPLLDITALYNVSDVSVFVDIGGDVESPKISLRSDPALQETDIISYLLFGSSSDKLGTGERSSLSQVAAGIAGGAMLNEFKGFLGEEFSPDVLSYGTGDAGPELEVGKYLSDDLYVAYERKSSTDASTPIPTDNVKVEYRLFDYLSVASEVGSEQSGGDLFFNFDF